MTEKNIQRMQDSGELLLNNNSENEAIKKHVDLLTNDYPFLKDYPDYIEFLKVFSGLTYLENDAKKSLSFYGFDDRITLDIVEGEGDIIDEKGFFVIGDYSYYNEKTEEDYFVGFGFDIQNTREKGYYSFNDSEEKLVAISFDELITIFLSDREKLLFKGFKT